MIRTKEQRMVNVMKEMRGGKLETTISSFLTQDEAHGTGRGFSINSLPPGGSIGWHKHEGDFEVYLILQGEATVVDNDSASHLLKPGDMMFCEDGESHSIENTGKERLDFLSLILFTPKK